MVNMQAQQQPQMPRLPAARRPDLELRELLEANLRALHAIFEDHQRTLAASLRKVTELHAEIRSLGTAEAPWVMALEQSRALLYVALRELIVGNNDAGVSLAMPRT